MKEIGTLKMSTQSSLPLSQPVEHKRIASVEQILSENKTLLRKYMLFQYIPAIEDKSVSCNFRLNKILHLIDRYYRYMTNLTVQSLVNITVKNKITDNDIEGIRQAIEALLDKYNILRIHVDFNKAIREEQDLGEYILNLHGVFTSDDYTVILRKNKIIIKSYYGAKEYDNIVKALKRLFAR